MRPTAILALVRAGPLASVAMQSGETQSFSYRVFIERDNLEEE